MSAIAETADREPPAPVVSVVIPTFNQVELLGRAIDSVVGQTYASWELLVVDDASECDVEAVVARYDDARVRYVRRSVNGGVAAAQNTGIDLASGELVAFLHTDDELMPRKLERQVDLVTGSHADLGAVESAVEVVWPDRTERWSPGLDGAEPLDLLAYRANVHISGLLVRTALAARLRFDEDLRGAEDRDFCVRLLRDANVGFSPEPLSRISKLDSRLGHQNKGPVYEHLLRKYHDDIAADRRVHADWHYRIARAYSRAGEVPAARQALRRSMHLDPVRPRRWLLWTASFANDRWLGAAIGAQVRAAAVVRRARVVGQPEARRERGGPFAPRRGRS